MYLCIPVSRFDKILDWQLSMLGRFFYLHIIKSTPFDPAYKKRYLYLHSDAHGAFYVLSVFHRALCPFFKRRFIKNVKGQSTCTGITSRKLYFHMLCNFIPEVYFTVYNESVFDFNSICTSQIHLSCVARKRTIVLADQVRYKPGCTDANKCKKIDVSELGRKGMVLSM